MNAQNIATVLVTVALALITIVFVATLTPLQGLGPTTFPILMLAIGLWLVSLLALIISLVRRPGGPVRIPRWGVALLVFSFLPLGYAYMYLSGRANTKITIEVRNHSDTVLDRVAIYGTGTLFAGKDTLRLDHLHPDTKTRFVIWPSTKPQPGGGKVGHIQMEFNAAGQHYSRVIAGEFSVYPLNIQQRWEVSIGADYGVY